MISTLTKSELVKGQRRGGVGSGQVHSRGWWAAASVVWIRCTVANVYYKTKRFQGRALIRSRQITR